MPKHNLNIIYLDLIKRIGSKDIFSTYTEYFIECLKIIKKKIKSL